MCKVSSLFSYLLRSLALTVLANHSCRLEIVGARFHCVECESVDICSNCDSNGLPGNIDSADGGHHSSHLLIKVHSCAILRTLLR